MHYLHGGLSGEAHSNQLSKPESETTEPMAEHEHQLHPVHSLRTFAPRPFTVTKSRARLSKFEVESALHLG